MTAPATPARLPIPDGYQMTVALTVAGQTAAVVLGGKYTGTMDKVQGADVWLKAFWDNFRTACTNQVTVTGAAVRKVDGSDLVIELGPPQTAGGFSNSPTPVLAACSLVKWSTTQGGRSGKGRTFLPGVPATGIAADGRTLATGHRDAVQGAVNGYLNSAALAGYGIVPSVLSFTKGAAYRITAGAPAGVVGIQRRRMR